MPLVPSSKYDGINAQIFCQSRLYRGIVHFAPVREQIRVVKHITVPIVSIYIVEQGQIFDNSPGAGDGIQAKNYQIIWTCDYESIDQAVIGP